MGQKIFYGIIIFFLMLNTFVYAQETEDYYKIYLDNREEGIFYLQTKLNPDKTYLVNSYYRTRERQFKEKTVFDGEYPVSYQLDILYANQLQSLKIDFSERTAKVFFKVGEKVFKSEINYRYRPYLLDLNMLSHLAFLIKNYNFQMKEEQRFWVIVPQRTPLVWLKQEQVKVAYRGRETVSVAGKDEFAHSLKIFSAGGYIYVWVQPETLKILKVEMSQDPYFTYQAELTDKKITVPSWPSEIKKTALVPSAKVREEKISVKSGEINLEGTLSLPAVSLGKRLPAVILLHDTGPLDRDGNDVIKFKAPGAIIIDNDFFKQIAYKLAEDNFIVLRYDKRGTDQGNPKQMNGLSDFVSDGLALANYLRNRSDVDSSKIFILGHGEGTWVGTRMMSLDPKLAGLILLSPMSSSFDEVLINKYLYQGRKLGLEPRGLDVLRTKVQFSIESLKREKGPYYDKFKEFFSYNQLTEIIRIDKPILILHGENNGQVPSSEALSLKKALDDIEAKGVEAKIFPELNHYFIKALPYETPKQTEIAPDILKTITDWLKSR